MIARKRTSYTSPPIGSRRTSGIDRNCIDPSENDLLVQTVFWKPAAPPGAANPAENGLGNFCRDDFFRCNELHHNDY
jgi:hypothetical protein